MGDVRVRPRSAVVQTSSFNRRDSLNCPPVERRGKPRTPAAGLISEEMSGKGGQASQRFPGGVPRFGRPIAGPRFRSCPVGSHPVGRPMGPGGKPRSGRRSQPGQSRATRDGMAASTADGVAWSPGADCRATPGSPLGRRRHPEGSPLVGASCGAGGRHEADGGREQQEDRIRTSRGVVDERCVDRGWIVLNQRVLASMLSPAFGRSNEKAARRTEKPSSLLVGCAVRTCTTASAGGPSVGCSASSAVSRD